jgi:hypothetical protein
MRAAFLFFALLLLPVLHAEEPPAETPTAPVAPAEPVKPALPDKITAEMSRDIIARLTEKYSKMYDKYAGCQSTRHLEIKWYKPEGMELVKTEKVVVTRYDDFYEDLAYTTHSYAVDGKPEKPGGYDPHEGAPGIPVFDRNGDREYLRSVVGAELVKGLPAYKIQVIPRKPKNEHFKGFIWATIDGLNLVQFQGTAGSFRIGLKELSVFFETQDFGDYYCFTAGHTEARIAFFIFQPERILHFKWHATDFKPMPKKKK